MSSNANVNSRLTRDGGRWPISRPRWKNKNKYSVNYVVWHFPRISLQPGATDPVATAPGTVPIAGLYMNLKSAIGKTLNKFSQRRNRNKKNRSNLILSSQLSTFGELSCRILKDAIRNHAAASDARTTR